MTTPGATGVTAAVTLTAKKSAANDQGPLTSLCASPRDKPTGGSAPDADTATGGAIPATVRQSRDAGDARGTQGAVTLRSESVALNSDVGAAFIIDCARNIEGAVSDAEVKSKWGLSDQDWVALADNALLLVAVRTEHERRVLSGECAREVAQRHFSKAPGVLHRILTDENIAPRHRIEAARELRQAAAGGPEIEPVPKQKFTIVFNLGAATEVHEKLIDPRGPLLLEDGTCRDRSVPFPTRGN